MRIKFNNHHLVAFGKQYSEFESQYAHSWKRTAVFSQLAVCISGTPEYILEKLKKMVSEMEGEAGKPIQGTMITNVGNIAEIITPIWAGEIIKTPEELNPVDPTDSDNDTMFGPDLPTEVAAGVPFQQNAGRLYRIPTEVAINENEYIGFTEEDGQESN